LYRQTPNHTDPHKGKGILLGTGKSNTHGVDKKDNVVLMMTNFLPSKEEEVKALYIGLGHRARVPRGMIN